MGQPALFGGFRCPARRTTPAWLGRCLCNIRCRLDVHLWLVNLDARDGWRQTGQTNLELTVIIGIIIHRARTSDALDTGHLLARFATRARFCCAGRDILITRHSAGPLLLLARLCLIVALIIAWTAVLLLTGLSLVITLVTTRALLLLTIVLLPRLRVIVTLIVARTPILLLTGLRLIVALVAARTLLLLAGVLLPGLHILIAIVATRTLLLLAGLVLASILLTGRDIVHIIAHAIIHEIAIRAFGAIILIPVIALARTPALLLFLTHAIVSQHAEIMVRKLEIIFHIHPVASHLRIARKVAIFLEQLGGIATCAVIDPVARISVAAVVATTTTAATLARVIPATTATDLTIIDQRFVPMLSTETWLPRLKAPSALQTQALTKQRRRSGLKTPRAPRFGQRLHIERRQNCGSRPFAQAPCARAGTAPFLADSRSSPANQAKIAKEREKASFRPVALRLA